MFIYVDIQILQIWFLFLFEQAWPTESAINFQIWQTRKALQVPSSTVYFLILTVIDWLLQDDVLDFHPTAYR